MAPKDGLPLPIVCLECWSNIINFHNFRESVLMTQSKLLKTQKILVVSHEKSLPIKGKQGTTSCVFYDIYVVDEETCRQSESSYSSMDVATEEMKQTFSYTVLTRRNDEVSDLKTSSTEGVVSSELTSPQQKNILESSGTKIMVTHPKKRGGFAFVSKNSLSRTMMESTNNPPKMILDSDPTSPQQKNILESTGIKIMLTHPKASQGTTKGVQIPLLESTNNTPKMILDSDPASEDDVATLSKNSEPMNVVDNIPTKEGRLVFVSKNTPSEQHVAMAPNSGESAACTENNTVKKKQLKAEESTADVDMETFGDGYFNDDQENMEISSHSEMESVDEKITSEDDNISLAAFAMVNIEEGQTHSDDKPNTSKKPISTFYRQNLESGREIKRRRSGHELEDIIAIWKKNLPCKHCDKTCSSFKLLNLHYTHEHPNEMFYVECCRYKFKRRNELAEHLLQHNNVESKCVTCNECGEVCRNIRGLRYHLTQKHSNNSGKKPLTLKVDILLDKLKQHLECGLCNRPYTTYKQLRAHFRAKHDFQKCFILCCGQKLYQPEEIEEHIIMHQDHSGVFYCKLCPQVVSFKERNSLNAHMSLEHQNSFNRNRGKNVSNVHNDGPTSSTGLSKSNNNDGSILIKRRKSGKVLNASIAKWRPTLECDICGGVCTDFSYLKHHFSRNHPDSRCYVPCCGIKFTRRSELEQHARLHMDYEAFRCKICGKVLRRQLCLRKHMEFMHKEQELPENL